MTENDHAESIKQGDVTPRFTLQEAGLLLLAARTFRVQSEDLLKDEAVEALDGAIQALLTGQSCPDPAELPQVGSVPPWMKFVCVQGSALYRVSSTTSETEPK